MKPLISFLAVLMCLLLTACGGGGSGGGMRVVDPVDVIEPIQSAFAAPTKPTQRPAVTPAVAKRHMTANLNQSAAAFGSVAMNLYNPGRAPVAGVDTTFTGDRFILGVDRADGSGFTLDTNRHYAEVTNDSTRSRNPVTDRPFVSGYMANVKDEEIVIAGIGVEWSNAEFTDYLAGGYWMTVDMVNDGFEMGAFVDGPDYRLGEERNFPITGTATYRGQASGLYVGVAGTDAKAPAGSTTLGEYEGRLRLTADFGTMEIAGRVDQVEFEGAVATADGNHYLTAGQTDVEMVFPAVSINQGNGTFWGDNVKLTGKETAITSSTGSWAGIFTNSDNQAGYPRAVAGTNAAIAETAGGTTIGLTGAFYGATERFE